MSDEQNPLPEISLDSTDQIDRHTDLLDDFIQQVFGLPWAFISDYSTLSDFAADYPTNEVLQRIQQIYGVDVSDIQDEPIVEILKRIASTR